MGLMDILKAAGGAVQKNQQHILERKEYYERCFSESDLLKMYKNKSGDDRIAILMILKERGYTSSDLD